MFKPVTILLSSALAFAVPAAAQIGAPGASDWAKVPAPRAVSPFSPAVPKGRADDYVSIVNLMNTYFIALDAGDIKTYSELFANDAALYWIGGVERGRAEIYKNLASFGTGRQKSAADATSRPRTIHTLGSQRIDFTGPNTAHDVTMWLAFSNRADGGKFEVLEFGHSEDKFVKIDGRWYFQERKIFNERLTNKALFYPELGEPDPRGLPGK